MHARFKKNGLTREVKAGFSWTVFFFGFVPFAFRQQWGWFCGMFVLGFMTFGLSSIVMAFFANKITARWLVENGWTTADPTPASWGIVNNTEVV